MKNKKNKLKEAMWNAQSKALRHPLEVITGDFTQIGLKNESLQYKVNGLFIKILYELKITLLITREYEHLVIALSADRNKLRQSFFSLPHPSGIAVDKKNNFVFIAATRNPNQILKLGIYPGQEKYRDKYFLFPKLSKFFSGRHYFHDLALINNTLYANSVGQNGVFEISFDDNKQDKFAWWPKSIEDKNKRPRRDKNYIQLNSIAAGDSLENSFFSASSALILSRRPGNLYFPVDKKGVIFSGKTREVYARGLTRPHSARLDGKTLWVDNSGYGEVGIVLDGKFDPVMRLPGWTRGLCLEQGYLFVGVSRVLPRFYRYAPGLTARNQICGIYILKKKTGEVVGSLTWPYGNQIFGIECVSSEKTIGFSQERLGQSKKELSSIFYSYDL